MDRLLKIYLTVPPKRHRLFGKIVIAVAIAALASGTKDGFTQTEEEAEDVALEEIVVTAQIREQRQQDVPVSLEAIGGDMMLREGFDDIESLSRFTTTLNIDASTPQNQVIKIRGIGTEGSNFGFEQAVPTFIDGVHFGRASQIFTAFLDVERVEVLRGPQPVFFGQNASGGAISVTTRKPTDEWTGFGLGEVGNDGIKKFEFGVGGPLSETFGIRIAGKYDYREGFMTNIVDGNKFPEREVFSGRVLLRWQATDRLEFTGKIDGSDVHTGGRGVAIVGAVARPDTHIGILVPGSDFEFTGAEFVLPFDDEINRFGIRKGPIFFPTPLSVREGFVLPNQDLVDLTQIAHETEGFLFDVTPRNDLTPWNGYLQADYTFANGILLTSQTAYSQLRRDYVRIFGGGGPFITAPLRREENLDQWSQEIRLTSPVGRKIEWMTGLYWQNNKLKHEADFMNRAFNSFVFGGFVATRGTEDATWLSAFATVTINFMEDRFSLDLGGRYTDVDKDATLRHFAAQFLVEGGVPASEHGQVAIGITDPVEFRNPEDYAQNFSDDDFNPQIVLRYRPTEDWSLYAKWARAFKAGGFDNGVVAGPRPADFQFQSETAENWEVGAKGDFFNGRANLNAVLFWTVVDDLQVSSFDQAAGRNRTTNAAKQRVRGLEFNGRALVAEGLTVGFSGALMDAEMLSFPGATCTEQEVELGLCTGPGGTIDRSGQRPIRTPKWQFLVNVDYTIPVFERFEVNFNGNVRATDGFLIDDNFSEIITMHDHTDVNLRMSFGDRGGRWQVALWGRNLTQPLPTYNPQFDFDNEAEEIALNPSKFRTYGIQLRYNWN